MIFQSGRTTVWFDPLVLPRLRYAPGELDAVYPITEARFLSHDDPGIAQPTLLDLPLPDAVVLSHEDADVCDLGLLACPPNTTPIIVPRWAGRAWEVDLAKTIPAIIGATGRSCSSVMASDTQLETSRSSGAAGSGNGRSRCR